MPKQNWTDEERQAFAEKMKASREAKKETPVVNEQTQTTVSNEDYNSLKAQVAELKALLQQNNHQQSGPQITSNGLIGTLKKFNTDPNYYPNPTERLAQEPRLARFAFGENWELDFSVK